MGIQKGKGSGCLGRIGVGIVMVIGRSQRGFTIIIIVT